MNILTSNYDNLQNIPKEYILVSVSEKISDGIKDKINIWDNRLAPTWDMYQEYKYSDDKNKYKERFLKERLSQLNLKNIKDEWEKEYGSDKTFVLLCYESSGKFCHRYIVREELLNIGCEELLNIG